MTTEEATKTETPTLTTEAPLPEVVPMGDIYVTPAAFEHCCRVAKVFAASKLVPEAYRGNLADCIIAIQMAQRLQIDPFTFMQNSAVVHGKPSMDGKLYIGLINSRGGFAHPLRFDYTGSGDTRAVLAWTVDKEGRRYEQAFSVKEAKAWGWWDRPQSAWPKMPDQMLAYRSAAFFARKYCPQVTLGLPPTDEVEDVIHTTAITTDPEIASASKSLEMFPEDKTTKRKTNTAYAAGV